MDFTKILPYQIGGNSTLENMTISMNATHYGQQLEFNVHNYYGYLMGKAAH